MAKASDILAIAQAELGVKEDPAGSNHVKYNTWYYGREVSGDLYPWCMVFVQWCFAQAGAKGLLPSRTASCGNLETAAKARGLWVRENLRPGDVVIYTFGHCGIIKEVRENTVIAYEGNTGIGNDANGGQVQQRQRPLSQVSGAVRPEYDPELVLDNTPRISAEAVSWARESGILRGTKEGDLMLSSPCTREHMIVFLWRFYQLIRKATEG